MTRRGAVRRIGTDARRASHPVVGPPPLSWWRADCRIRRTRSGADSCSYEEDKFLNTPGLELLGLPATPGVGLWRADRCRIEWFGRGAATGNCSLGWPAVPPAAGSSLGCTTVGHPCRGVSSRSESDRQPIRQGLPATSGTERGGGFAPRYYNATHIWASTTRTETLLQTASSALTPMPDGHRQPPRAAAPLPWWRVFGSRRKGRRGFDHWVPRQFTDQWVATSEGWRWLRLQAVSGFIPFVKTLTLPRRPSLLRLARCR